MADKLMRRSERGWAVIEQDGRPTRFWGLTRREAIMRLVGEDDGWQKRWRYWRTKLGCRCVRARLTIEREAPDA